MWIIQKVQESAGNLPVQLSQLISKNKEEISAKTSLFKKLHYNVLTPDKIPDFFLPPKLTRRCLPAETEKISQCLNEERKGHSSRKTSLSRSASVQQSRSSFTQSSVALNKLKPIPYSLKCYESGLFESPNTRRKESLFHSALTSYTLERMTIKAPKLPCRAVLNMTIIESDMPSADSTPHSSPQPIRRENFTGECSMPHLFSGDPLQLDVLHTSREETKKVHSPLDKTSIMPRVPHRAKVVQASCCTKLAPPIQFPLDMLHCQERFHQEHVLPLPQRGHVRISAFRSSATGCSTTVRIRVISVEGLRDLGDFRPLTCSLTLSLTPGKMQRQHSAIIRNCLNPVFNEDFFFTESGEQEGRLRDLALRLKVLDKPSGLGRGVVLGIVIKPLCQLLPL
ncbi:C2 calcium-dependent domain-containing protein 4C-like [Myxocyprinus asiaticus]|uniref:C2 calcium-dependent domain-containing protein 4C-like n=1 Tax=Myxocyprinus asiaticus TaxID=70543 RepID=UPI002223990A|nr:C2 calcium-dependent domain-containing protein 4C-like [Myxocyprinus asiaticus]